MASDLPTPDLLDGPCVHNDDAEWRTGTPSYAAECDDCIKLALEAARLEGWREGREAALSAALDVIFSAFEPRPALRQTIEGDMVRAIRALPEPGTEGAECFLYPTK